MPIARAIIAALGAVPLLLLAVSGPASAAELTVQAREGEACAPHTFCFEPRNLTARAGDAVNVTMANAAANNAPHSICFGLPNGNQCTPNPVAGTAPGSQAVVRFVAPAAGTVPYWCEVPGHRALGMEGNLTVMAAAPGPGNQTGDTNATGGPGTQPPPGQRTPGPGAVAALAALALLAYAIRRR